MPIQQTIQFIQIARSVSPCNKGRQPNDERRNVIAALFKQHAIAAMQVVSASRAMH
jgi:hypothetical protein